MIKEFIYNSYLPERNRKLLWSISFHEIYILITYKTVFDIVEFFALWNRRALLNNKSLFLYGLLPLICIINFCKWQFKVKTINIVSAITTNVCVSNFKCCSWFVWLKWKTPHSCWYLVEINNNIIIDCKLHSWCS